MAVTQEIVHSIYAHGPSYQLRKPSDLRMPCLSLVLWARCNRCDIFRIETKGFRPQYVGYGRFSNNCGSHIFVLEIPFEQILGAVGEWTMPNIVK